MMKPRALLAGLDLANSAIARLCTLVSGSCLVLLVVVFGWLVYGRYVLDSTPTWVEPLSLLLIVMITFLSAAVGVREGTHLSVEILSNLLPTRMQSGLGVLVNAILVLFGVVMAKQSYLLAQFMWSQKIPLLDVPEGLRSLPMTLSGGLIALFAIENIFHILAGEGMPTAEQDNTLPGSEMITEETR